MKKGIIATLPLGRNYGGVMQAWALREYMQALSGDRWEWLVLGCKSKRNGAKELIKKVILSLPLKKIKYFSKTKLLEDFINQNMCYTEDFSKSKDANAYISGSDQVWRASYSDVEATLFNFVEKKSSMKFISYAASFGIDDILEEYDEDLIKRTKKLIRKFDAVSVREDSGIANCRKYWGTNAVQMVDPTLLINKKDYEDTIDGHKVTDKEGVFLYVLDRDTDKINVAEKVRNVISKKTYSIIVDEEKTLPSIEQWLNNFRTADFVVTDSFHGCVFSIIFNKPFIAIANKSRGLTRFTSLLKMFDLSDRLVCGVDDLDESMIVEEIDWRKVNLIIQERNSESKEFLRKALYADSAEGVNL